MSNLNVRSITGKDGQPVSFPTGITLGAGTSQSNNIGIPGQAGFGVGVCPGPLPAGMGALPGYDNPLSDNYGNYQYSDGSVMVWIPAFYYKWGTGSNGLTVNAVDIKRFSHFTDTATANAAGYALHRAFYDGGVRDGFFLDKYLASNNGGIFSSVKLGIPCDTDGSQSGVGSITGVGGTNNYGMVQLAAKSRGPAFHGASIFMLKALALLAYAHAQASTSTTYCAWYHATNNFPKGCNNNALGDAQDGDLSFLTAGHGSYPAKPLAGSANLFSRTTHNGQNSGVADVNGSMWQVAFGLTSDGTAYYALKTSKRLRDLTGSTGAASDLFGSAGITANYDSLGTSVGVIVGSNAHTQFGSASQVFDAATSGTLWQATGAGIPIAEGGTNAFGNDGIWDYKPNEMCPIVGAYWSDGSNAGGWALALSHVRSYAYYNVGGRAACYL